MTKANKAKYEALIVQLEQAGYIIYGIIEPDEIEYEIDQFNSHAECQIKMYPGIEERLIELTRYKMNNGFTDSSKAIYQTLEEIIDVCEHPIGGFPDVDMYYEERRGG